MDQMKELHEKRPDMTPDEIRLLDKCVLLDSHGASWRNIGPLAEQFKALVAKYLG